MVKLAEIASFGRHQKAIYDFDVIVDLESDLKGQSKLSCALFGFLPTCVQTFSSVLSVGH